MIQRSDGKTTEKTRGGKKIGKNENERERETEKENIPLCRWSSEAFFRPTQSQRRALAVAVPTRGGGGSCIW